MKKNTFYSIFFVAMLTGCAVIESSDTYSTEAIRNAELGVEQQLTTEGKRLVKMYDKINGKLQFTKILVY